jgi:5'-nucleotidase
MTKPLFLLCNDDGVHAPGIKALATAMEKYGDVIVVAPHVERSGSGQGLSLTLPLRMERLTSNTYAVEGSPTDCMIFALNRILDRKPSWVLSGINRGANIGQDVFYSGTVAAAMEGCIHGIPSIAFSLAKNNAFELQDYADCIKVVRAIFDQIELFTPAHGNVLNVNIPNVPFADMKGFKVTTQGRRIYEAQIAEAVDPRGRPYYWIGGGGSDFEVIPGSDCNLLAEKYVTISVLTTDRINHNRNAELEKKLKDFSKMSMT